MRRYMIIGLGLLLVELCAAWAWGEAAQQRLLAIGWDSRPALREEQGAEEQEAAERPRTAAEELKRRMEAMREEVKRRTEPRRIELRGTKEGHFSVSKENYLALLALPEPPLRDCFPATFVFRRQKDWPALAIALEAAGATLLRVMNAPAEEFVKATDDQPPEDAPAVCIHPGDPVPRHVVFVGPGTPGPPAPWKATPGVCVYVQADLDGRWHFRRGSVSDWLPVLRAAQQSLPRDCAGIYWELGGLYRDKLGRPQDAVRAYRKAVAQERFCVEPLDRLVPQVWPETKIDKEVLWPISTSVRRSRTHWSTRQALRDLADAQEQVGDIENALKTRTRVMLAVLLLDGRHNANYRKELERIWSLVRRLPADAELPPLPWFNILTPDRPVIRFDLDAAETQPANLNVVAGPGKRFATVQITADMESQGGYGWFECYSLSSGMQETLGYVQWHLDKRRGQENRTVSFEVPADANVLHFLVLGHVQVHSATVTATFAPSVSEPARVKD